MNREGTNCTDRIADSRRSTQSYLLPYSKLKKENYFDNLDSREDFKFCVSGTLSQNNGGWGGGVGPKQRDKQMRNFDTGKTTTKMAQEKQKQNKTKTNKKTKNENKKAHEITIQQKQQQSHMKKQKQSQQNNNSRRRKASTHNPTQGANNGSGINHYFIVKRLHTSPHNLPISTQPTPSFFRQSTPSSNNKT